MRVIGHRGTPTGPRLTENTLPAVAAALEAGADGVEVDVRATADGVLVLAHDPDLGRVLGTGAGTGPVVADTRCAELRGLRLPGGSHVPSLDEVLDLAAAARALVVAEVKAGLGSRRARTAVLLAEHLDRRRRRRPGADRVVTSSFDALSARTLAGRGTVGGAVILEPWQDPRRTAGWARRWGLTELHLSVEHVRRDPAVVAGLHARGLAVAAGIVDDPGEAAGLARLGVDLLCTDAVTRVGRGALPQPVGYGG
ncbi:glycerophosphodiester phosphodiesterase [Geodermatophilus sp. SYSU D01176]